MMKRSQVKVPVENGVSELYFSERTVGQNALFQRVEQVETVPDTELISQSQQFLFALRPCREFG